MNRTISTIVALILCLQGISLTNSSLWAESNPAALKTLTERFETHKTNLSQFFPRKEGSLEEKNAFLYIRNVLEKRDLNLEERDFSTMRGGHSFSQILSVFIPGKSPNRVMFAVPLSQEETGEDPMVPHQAGSDGIALALSLIEEWGQKPPPSSILFLFLGGDTGYGEGIGSRLFLQDFYASHPTVLFYLNLPTIPSRLVIQTGSRNSVTPAFLIQPLLRFLSQSRLPFILPESKNQLYRMGVPVNPTPLGPYLREGVAALGLAYDQDASRQHALALEDWLFGMEQTLFHFIESFGTSFPGDWDTHYLIFRIGSKFLFIDEMETVSILLVVLSICAVVAYIRKRQTLRYIRTLLRNLWNLPLIFLIIFFFLVLGTSIIRGIERLRAPLWYYAPFLHFSLKILFSVFLFSLASHALHRLPLARKGSFYSAASLLFFFVNILIFSFINIALCYYFLWGFLCAMGFSFFRSKIAKSLFFVLSPLWLYRITFDIFTQTELPMIRILLTSLHGNILLSFMLLPFFLMIIRIDFLLRHPVYKKIGWGIKSTFVLSGIGTVFLIGYLLSYSPFQNKLIPVLYREKVDFIAQEHVLTLESALPFPEITLWYNSLSLPVLEGKRIFETSLPLPEDPITIDIVKNPFLDRATYRITLSSTLSTHGLSIRLHSPIGEALYASNFPFTREMGGEWTTIHVGKNPPIPLVLVCTVPRQSVWKLEIVLSAEPKELPVLEGSYTFTQQEYLVRKEVLLGTT